jgi:hypothetical protein
VNRKTVKTVTLGAFALIVVLAAAWQAQAQGAKAQYPAMAPIDQYLMADSSAEIAMARSAAPAAISSDAEVLVLGPHGYKTAVKGKNGFVCVVERSWMSPFDHAEFWNPKIRGPICFNPAAARSILPITYKRTEFILAGLSKAQVIASTKAAVAKEVLSTLEPGALSYMMSKQGYLSDSGGHWVPHLMFYAPQPDGAAWGADVPHSPVIMGGQFQDAPEPVTLFMVPVLTWSDGAAAPTDAD